MAQVKYSLALATLFSGWIATATAADIQAGAEVYEKSCAKCHSISKPMQSKKAPSLLGIMGRSSSRISGYKYSEAMRTANLTWTTEKLDEFLINPKAVVPNNKMKFKGMARAEDRANLIEFLQLQQ
ncbi:MAG TPA: c-type cytochrome [Cellvibrio sp.]|nr:c-type cytochrome [Cellvibrio sp.]